jgi:hypothetical protein
MDRDSRSSTNNSLFVGLAIAAALVVGYFMFWPSDSTRTASRDGSPRVERPTNPAAPTAEPAKPQPQKAPAQ